MNTKIFFKSVFLIAFLSLGLTYAELPLTSQEDEELFKMENYLKKARIIKVNKTAVGSRTAPWIISLDDGQAKHRAIFKHVNRQRPAILPDSYRYELAAYELGKLLGVDFIPPLVERKVNGKKGSLQIMVENTMTENYRQGKNLEPPDPQAFEDSLEEIKIFEALVRDECLDRDDILIHKTDWKIWRIDFSEAFGPAFGLIPGCEIKRCSEQLYGNLQKVEDKLIESTLSSYLNAEEIRALIERKNLIVAEIKKLIEQKGEEAVLFSKK